MNQRSFPLCMALHGMAWHGMALPDMAWPGMALPGIERNINPVYMLCSSSRRGSCVPFNEQRSLANTMKEKEVIELLDSEQTNNS